MAEDNRNPYLVITCGNTGSGKTRLMEETLKFLGISNEPYVKILIDDIVENNLIYKREVKKIISKIERYCREKRVHCLDEDCFFVMKIGTTIILLSFFMMILEMHTSTRDLEKIVMRSIQIGTVMN